MNRFHYQVRNKTGLHNRHIGQLAARARAFRETAITVTANGRSVKPTQTMRLATLGITQGCNVTVTTDGPRENEALAEFQQFFEYYL